jgi:hypothetical protein
MMPRNDLAESGNDRARGRFACGEQGLPFVRFGMVMIAARINDGALPNAVGQPDRLRRDRLLRILAGLETATAGGSITARSKTGILLARTSPRQRSGIAGLSKRFATQRGILRRTP